MTRFPLEIERYMTTVIVVVGPNQPLSEAIRLMRLHEVRHLPVVEQGKLAGVISQRDVYLMQSLERTDPSRVLVSEVMTRDPYTIEPDEQVDRVAREMVRRKIGTALVTHGPRLMGLFTASDALLALAALVEDDRIPGEEAEDEIVPARPGGETARRKRPARRGKAAGRRAKRPG
jgi:acetoin utilization protein AcuB